MTRLILRFTVGQLLRQRRTLLLVLLAVLPVALALLFRLAADGTAADTAAFASGILTRFVVALVLPLTALVVGTSALGQEIEDGTAVYLVGKPLPRWNVVLAKVGAAWLVTSAVVVLSVIASGYVLLAGSDHARLVVAFAGAVVVGALAYAAVFVSLSVRFSRALIFGLVYVFVWETLVSQFIVGVRFLSVRAYTMSFAEWLAASSSRLIDSSLGLTPAAILMALLTTVSLWYGIRRLEAFELSEQG
jgi:ABC-2 type transport system permease protein